VPVPAWGIGIERIAEAKGCSRSVVKFVLSYSVFPNLVLEKFGTNPFLKEGHARELRELVQCTNLSPWLTRETAMLYVIEQSMRLAELPPTVLEIITKGFIKEGAARELLELLHCNNLTEGENFRNCGTSLNTRLGNRDFSIL